MREVSEEVVEVTVEKEAQADGGKLTRRRKDAGEGGGDGLVKWERFLPKITLRVLLVEADDSTRQIISALLKKCSYKVVAVSDGLKAWDMLKQKPETVDLILTEVDLPSISGYALLTLTMEHDLCKNIPVIMMSTQDSVNTVYKCMLKGAVDYLVKPLRRNEMRNLWQHVWRRQSSLGFASFPLDESVGKQKLEGPSANDSTSNHGDAFDRNAKSSCTRPEMEGESGNREDKSKDSSKEEAIDFMGASSLRRNGQCNREESIAKYESRIELDLSLKGPENRPSLHPSSASAFTWYVHRPLQTQCSVSSVTNQRNNVAASQGDNINQHISSKPPPNAPRRSEAGLYTRGDSPGPPTFSNQISSWPGQSSCPKPIPIKSIPYTSPNTAYASTMHPPSLFDQEERRHNSSATEQSAIGKKNKDGYSSSVGKIQHSLQREAALTKFRMKRKDRCFEKKVRYESRKKLAEQRPRIKGQFVRQVQSTETSNQAITE